ncbi:FHA domain-containing protein [Nonomuraea candida]|uniref:FHA domain-containing protein n=1 Tax=Nonomuraea candida TaxID=359159 RepID=UPI0005BA718E|nr:FHA domain-containing protein [Nonomuraea candida]
MTDASGTTAQTPRTTETTQAAQTPQTTRAGSADRRSGGVGSSGHAGVEGSLSEAADRPWPGSPISPFELVLVRPRELRGLRLPVSEVPAEIGRTAPLRIDSQEISRRHARVWLAGGSAWIADCDSTNGTWVNGTRIHQPVRLPVGERVRMGGVEAVLQIQGGGVPDEHHTTSAPIQRPTNTTRYLCAAAHISEPFARAVIDETLGHPFRACAPSYGVDLPAVLKHALAAERRRTARDVLLLLIGAGTIALLAAGVAGALPDLDALDSVNDLDDLGALGGSGLLRLAPLVLLPLALAWLVVAAHVFHTRVVVLGRRLSARRFSVAEAPSPVSAAARREVARLTRAQRGNVVVFTDYLPFVGCGFPHDHGWSFAIDITKVAQEGKPPRPFHSDDVHACLAREIAATGLPNLGISERLFINGVDINHASELLPDRLAPPVTTVDSELVRAVSRAPESSARAYLCVEVIGWGGQLVVTIFLRAVRLRGSLFLEGSTYELYPLAPEYSLVDRVSSDLLTGLFVALTHGAAQAVPRLVTAPLRLARLWGRGAARRRQERDDRAVIQGHGLYDYGAHYSVREMAMGDDPRRFFITRDVEMFDKVVLEAVDKGLARFLAEHNIDTGEAAARITQITNNKVTISGGQQHGINFGKAEAGSHFGARTGQPQKGGTP